MKVLVTGATGFIGSALCRTLCEEGYDVIAFHRPSSILSGIENLPLQRRMGDLSDPDSIAQAFTEKPELVFHLGAQMAAGRNKNRMLDVNVAGTRRVFQAAIRHNVRRVILTSTAFTLGVPESVPGVDLPLLMTEEHVWNFSPDRWPYAWSKYLAEREVQLASTQGLDAVILNPSLVIGPGDLYRRTNSFLLRMRTPKPFLVQGGVNLVHVQDVVRGMIRAAEYGGSGERYLLSGTNISIPDLYALVGKIAGFSVPKLVLSHKLSKGIFDFLNSRRNPAHIGSMESNLFQFAGHYFYYDSKKTRLSLRLPPFRDLQTSLEESWNWFQGE